MIREDVAGAEIRDDGGDTSRVDGSSLLFGIGEALVDTEDSVPFTAGEDCSFPETA